MTKAKIMEVKGKLLQKLMEGIGEIEGLDLPQELLEAIGEHTKEKNRREVLVCNLSDELVEKFVEHSEYKHKNAVLLKREQEDWHREFTLKTDAITRTISRQHDALWAEAYAEMGIVKDDKRRFSINREEGTISELFFDDDEDENQGNLFDFRPKVH